MINLHKNQCILQVKLLKMLPKWHIHQITNQLSTRSDSLNHMRIAIQEGDELVLLKHTITNGWSSTIREVPSKIQPYWTFREELTVEDSIILEGTWIVVPHKKHQATLQLIHEGHLSLGKCNLRAKDTVYWPGLNDQHEKLLLNCELCLKYSHSKYKQKPSASLRQEIPVHPWTKFDTDIFHFEGASYVLIVDFISRFPQAFFNDRCTHCKPMQASVFRIWMAWDPHIRSWSMLYPSNIHQCHESL